MKMNVLIVKIVKNAKIILINANFAIMELIRKLI